jgi:MFS family permease
VVTKRAPELDPPSVGEEGKQIRPMQSAAFRWLWFSTGVASGGQMMERTATAWLALQSGGGAVGVGLVFAARSLPSLLFGLAAGTIADRADRRKQLMLVAAAMCVLMAFVGWLAVNGEIRVWQVVVLSFAAGCVQVCDTPARQALVLDTTSRKSATNALALNGLASRSCGALGAIGAGALIPLVGIGHSYFAIAAVYGIGGLLIIPMRMPRGVRVTVAHPPFIHALRDAGRLIVDLPAVRILMFSGIAGEIFAFSFGSALPVFSKDVLRAGPEGLGTLNGASSIGSAVALILLLALGDRLRREPLLVSIFVAFGVSMVLLATTRNMFVAAAVLVVTGICAGAFDLLQQTLIQLAVPDEQRGRAVGIWVLSLGSAPVGNLEMGALIGGLGAPGALAINGALAIASAATLAARASAFRWKLREQPIVD